MKPCYWFALLACAVAAAQTPSITTPWVSKSTTFDLTSYLAGPMAVDSAGDVFVAFGPGSGVQPTSQAGNAATASNLIAKASAGGQVGFVLKLGGSDSVWELASDGAGNAPSANYQHGSAAKMARSVRFPRTRSLPETTRPCSLSLDPRSDES